MRRSFRVPSALVCVLVISAVAGCGGDDDAGSDIVAAPDPGTRVSADQFRTGFASETGVELTASDFPGETVLLGFDDDGDPMASSDAETAFVEEFGTAQIYVVEPDGDPELILDAVTGESRDDTPVESGGDTVRLITNVAEPDADGVIWTRQCVRYEKQTVVERVLVDRHQALRAERHRQLDGNERRTGRGGFEARPGRLGNCRRRLIPAA